MATIAYIEAEVVPSFTAIPSSVADPSSVAGPSSATTPSSAAIPSSVAAPSLAAAASSVVVTSWAVRLGEQPTFLRSVRHRGALNCHWNSLLVGQVKEPV